MKIGDVVVWHAQTSQRLAAIVMGVNKDGTLRLKVRSDTEEEIWSGEGCNDTRLVVSDAKGNVVQRIGDDWSMLHRNVPHGDPKVDPRTGVQAAQAGGMECWLAVDEVEFLVDGEGKLLDPADERLKARLVELG